MKNKPNFFFDNRGFPNWGGPPLGNFSHIIPFFSLITILKSAACQRIRQSLPCKDLERTGKEKVKAATERRKVTCKNLSHLYPRVIVRKAD